MISSFIVSHTTAIKCVSAELTVLIEPLVSTSASCPLVALKLPPAYAANAYATELRCVEPSKDLNWPVHLPSAHPKS